MSQRKWCVCDMDDGVVRIERTKAAAIEWFRLHSDATRTRQTRIGPHAYEVSAGVREDMTSAYVLRLDVLVDHGWNPLQPALYPVPEKPSEYVERKEAQE